MHFSSYLCPVDAFNLCDDNCHMPRRNPELATPRRPFSLLHSCVVAMQRNADEVHGNERRQRMACKYRIPYAVMPIRTLARNNLAPWVTTASVPPNYIASGRSALFCISRKCVHRKMGNGRRVWFSAFGEHLTVTSNRHLWNAVRAKKNANRKKEEKKSATRSRHRVRHRVQRQHK